MSFGSFEQIGFDAGIKLGDVNYSELNERCTRASWNKQSNTYGTIVLWKECKSCKILIQSISNYLLTM